MVCSGSLAPCFVIVNNVTAEIIYSTVHACHKVLTWSRTVWGTRIYEFHQRKQWCYYCVTAMPSESATRGGNIAWTLLGPLCQPGENTAVAGAQPGQRLHAVTSHYVYVCCYRCCVSKKRIKVPVVPTAPLLCFQPLSLHPAYLDSVNSAGSVNSQTTGAVNRMKSDPPGVASRIPNGWSSLRLCWMEEASGQHIACGTVWPRSSVWALMGNWEVVDGHWIAWKGVTGHELPFAERGGKDCPWHHGVDYPDCLEGEYG